MEFLDVVGSRRSIRWYEPDRPVARASIQRVLEAARFTSSPGNLQPWRAIVVLPAELPPADRDLLLDAGNRQHPHTLAPVWVYWFADPTVIVPTRFLEGLAGLMPSGALAPGLGWTDQEVRDAILDGAALREGLPDLRRLVHELPEEAAAFVAAQETNGACMVALLAAVNEGLGTSLMSVAVPERQDDVKRLLSVPAEWLPIWIQLIGHPAERPEAGGQRPRMSFGELFAWRRWGAPMDRDPDVVQKLRAERLLQDPGPLPGRFEELDRLSERLGPG